MLRMSYILSGYNYLSSGAFFVNPRKQRKQSLIISGGKKMLLSDIILQTILSTNTTRTECAAALGISKQNFGQRLLRDSFNLEETTTIIEACGCEIEIHVRYPESNSYII